MTPSAFGRRASYRVVAIVDPISGPDWRYSVSRRIVGLPALPSPCGAAA
jgi:hypothetical protein